MLNLRRYGSALWLCCICKAVWAEQVVFAPVDGIISDSSVLELNKDHSEVNLSVLGDRLGNSCDSETPLAGPRVASVPDNFCSYDVQVDGKYTPFTATYMDAIQLRLKKTGNPIGNILIKVYADNGSGWPGSFLESSTLLESSHISNDPLGAFYTFSFDPVLKLNVGSSYHFVLLGDPDYVAKSSEGAGIQRLYTNPNVRCSTNGGFAGLLGSNTGVDWFNNGFPSSTVGIIKTINPFFTTSAPTISYTHDASKIVHWILSSFTAVENPNGESGKLTYDLGTSIDGVAQYALYGLNLDQVQKATSFKGRYFHLRVRFSSDGTQPANLGAISINYSN